VETVTALPGKHPGPIADLSAANILNLGSAPDPIAVCTLTSIRSVSCKSNCWPVGGIACNINLVKDKELIGIV
jgi:hypothetical protein